MAGDVLALCIFFGKTPLQNSQSLSDTPYCHSEEHSDETRAAGDGPKVNLACTGSILVHPTRAEGD